MPIPGVRFRQAVATALALGACARVPTQSASMQVTPAVVSTAALVQVQSFETGRNISTIIEQAADSIMAVTTDPVVRRNALVWKISAIPLVQEAALRTDPVIAAADLYSFTIQLSDYLGTGSGSHAFGAEQPIAVAAAADAERAAKGLVDGSVKDGQLSPQSDSYLRRWAAAHPMQGPALRRASLLSSDWKALGVSEQSLAATVGNVDRTLTNITYRLSYLNESLAEQARWNAELAGGDALRAPRVDSLLGSGTTTLRSVGLFADDFPTLLDREREALMRDVDRQRILAFQDIAAQRVALQAALNQERATLMSEVREERIAAFRSVDSVAVRTIEQSGAMLRRLAWQITLSALVVALVLFAGGVVIVNRWRTKPA